VVAHPRFIDRAGLRLDLTGSIVTSGRWRCHARTCWSMFTLSLPRAQVQFVGGDNTSVTMVWARLLVSAAGTLTAIGLSASAHADNGDAALLDQLDRAGIEFADPQDTVSTAKTVCSYLAEGRPVTVVARALKIRNHHLSNNNALQFVEIAGETYCPADLSAAVSG